MHCLLSIVFELQIIPHDGSSRIQSTKTSVQVIKRLQDYCGWIHTHSEVNNLILCAQVSSRLSVGHHVLMFLTFEYIYFYIKGPHAPK